MQEYCIKTRSNICFGYLLESPLWGDSNKYPKHTFYEEIRINKVFLTYHSIHYLFWCQISDICRLLFYCSKLLLGKLFICIDRLNVKQHRSRWDGSLSRLIWIYAVCKSLLLSPVAVKELRILYNSKFILMATSLGTNAVVVTRVHCIILIYPWNSADSRRAVVSFWRKNMHNTG